MTKADDRTLTLGELKTIVRDFAGARAWDERHGPKDLAIGLVTEASELLELFRFRTEVEIARDLGDPVARGAVADELADALFCLLRFAQRFEFDLSRALREKMVKTAARYPARA